MRSLVSIILVVFAVLLGIVAVGSAFGKLSRNPRVVESMHDVGVTDPQMRGLAVLEILGALGLLVGIWLPWLGLLAAACLTVYFLCAAIAHLRAKQGLKEAAAPIALTVLALITTALELRR